jgi:hypothetical protein
MSARASRAGVKRLGFQSVYGRPRAMRRKMHEKIRIRYTGKKGTRRSDGTSKGGCNCYDVRAGPERNLRAEPTVAVQRWHRRHSKPKSRLAGSARAGRVHTARKRPQRDVARRAQREISRTAKCAQVSSGIEPKTRDMPDFARGLGDMGRTSRSLARADSRASFLQAQEEGNKGRHQRAELENAQYRVSRTGTARPGLGEAE